MRDAMEIVKKIIKCFKYYFVFHKSLPFIFVMIVVHALVEYALVAILITHLTDELLHLPKAASIVNVQDGTTSFLVLVVAYASDAYLGPFISLFYTSLAYITGLSILYFAASRPSSIQIKMLYAAVIFVGFGRAGRSVSLKEFLSDQLRESCEDEIQVGNRRRVLWRCASFLGFIVSWFAFTNTSCIQRCKIFDFAMVGAFLWFLLGSSFYKFNRPTNSSPNSLLRVIYAALAKRHLPHSSSGGSILLSLRWLDKAAIVESSPSVEEQERRGRHCTVEQVEEAKSVLKMVPLCMTFLVYGLLQATGNTFFYEQANCTDKYLGDISIPTFIFVVIKSSTCLTVSWFCELLFRFFWGERTPRLAQLVKIGIGMLIAPLCCLVAWKVEVYRVHKDVHKESISFLWLVPQFLLLGSMDGLVIDGLEELYASLVPASLSKYGPSFAEFALGIGQFLAMTTVLIFRNLFANDLDHSRLGVYYRNLVFVCLVNLFPYLLVVPYYHKQAPSAAPESLTQIEKEEVLDAHKY